MVLMKVVILTPVVAFSMNSRIHGGKKQLLTTDVLDIIRRGTAKNRWMKKK